jgi:hypothetical protein
VQPGDRVDWKGKLSLALYAVAIVLALRAGWRSLAIYVAVALVWLIPDRRIANVAVHETR